MAPAPDIFVPRWVPVRQTRAKEPIAIEVGTIGPDLAENALQVQGAGKEGTIVLRKVLRQAQHC
jgi:hypothetical protein